MGPADLEVIFPSDSATITKDSTEAQEWMLM